MKQFLIVFIGSGLGGLLRFCIGKWFSSWYHNYFPLGTFVINILACLLLGLLLGFANQKNIITPNFQLFFGVGFCGGFSTFSTFSSETISLFQQEQYLTSFLYIFGSVFVSLAAVFGGLYIAGKL
ncbi:MAG: fluoride efflux transporter CrcB [Flavobacterium sp.]